MKPENIFLLAIVGLGLWYLSRQPAAAATVKTPFAIDTDAIQSSFDAVRRARAGLPPLRTAQTGYIQPGQI